MLDNTSKEILSLLKPYALQHSNLSIPAEQIVEHLPQFTPVEIKSSLNYLEENNYLTLLKFMGDKYVVYGLKHKGLHYDEIETAVAPSQNITIGTVNNSAIGNNGSTTINNGFNLEEIRSLISSKPVEDQEDLNKVVNAVEIITEDSETVSKGFLYKFSDILAKHSDVAIALSTGIMNWLTTK